MRVPSTPSTIRLPSVPLSGLLPWLVFLACCSGWPPALLAQPDVAIRLRANLARFDALCRDSRHAPSIRVLIYGQSITARAWTTEAFRPLLAAYPSRAWTLANRCIPGFTAPYLLRTAEADLFTFDPDLVVFHAYGDPQSYASLVAEIRRRTTADILLLNDHYARWDESTFPELGEWSGRALPGLALAHHACMADVRIPWRDSLLRSGLAIPSLLQDEVHPNAAGEAILQQVLTDCLQATPRHPLPDPFENDRVASLSIPPDAMESGTWVVPFHGNRVMALAGPGIARFRLNGEPPSATVHGRVHGRAGPWPGTVWPFVLRIRHESPLTDETWTLRIDSIVGLRELGFSVSGSRTGPDGSGSSSARFRSNSGRVVIEPSDWSWEALLVQPAPGTVLSWSTVARCANFSELPDPFPETWVNVVAGLPTGHHQLVIHQRAGSPAIRKLLVYSPPTPRAAAARPVLSGDAICGVQLIDPGYRYATAPAVSFEGSHGPTAIALAHVSNGVVTGVQMVREGGGYSSKARVVVDPPPIPPRTAAAGCAVRDGVVVGAWIIDGGHGYYEVPQVSLVGGEGHGAMASARLRDGAVVGIDVIHPGEGYRQAPVVQVDPPGPPPPLRIEPLPSAVRLRLAAPAPWRIQWSTNLSTWADLGVFGHPDPPFVIHDAPEDSPPRFFRLATP